MSSSNSMFGKMLDNVLPRVPPFFTLFTVQTEVLVNSMNTMVKYMEDGKAERVEELVRLDAMASDLRGKHLDILNGAFSTPLDRQDCLDTITNLEIPVITIRVIAQEMDILGIAPDKYTMEMAVLLRESAASLQRGYAKLENKPREADADSQTAILGRTNLDRAYRKALASIYDVEEDIKNMTNRTANAEANAMRHIVDILKRREIYRHLRESGNQLAVVGSLLHGIVVKIG